MIKINLLPQRKIKRAALPGEKHLVVGFASIMAAAVTVFVAFHLPKSNRLDELARANGDLNGEIAAKQGKLTGFEELKKVVEAAKKRSDSIDALHAAQIVPAHVLHELAEILTSGKLPTMSEEMSKRVTSDPNRRFALDWDPRHVWITEFTERKGDFTIRGGAQSDADVTQLAKRMQASVYFQGVTPNGAERLVDRESSISYFKFTITGKLVY